MEDIADAHYTHANRTWKKFSIKDLREYHDLYVQSDTFLLADILQNLKYTNLELQIFFRLLD